MAIFNQVPPSGGGGGGTGEWTAIPSDKVDTANLTLLACETDGISVHVAGYATTEYGEVTIWDYPCNDEFTADMIRGHSVRANEVHVTQDLGNNQTYIWFDDEGFFSVVYPLYQG